MRTASASVRSIGDVAELLGDLRDEVVFVGGAAIPLLITDDAAGEERATYDVDIVVEATSPATYYAVADRLRGLGFSEDRHDDPPVICRWKHGPYRVDVMPVDGGFMGFHGAWFRAVCDRSWSFEVKSGVAVRLARAPELLATKVEAFRDRGKGDYVVSKDIQDFVAIVNGRAELLQELTDAPADVRKFVGETVARWLQDDDFMEAVPGQLHGDEASQHRVPMVVARLRSIGELAR